MLKNNLQMTLDLETKVCLQLSLFVELSDNLCQNEWLDPADYGTEPTIGYGYVMLTGISRPSK